MTACQKLEGHVVILFALYSPGHRLSSLRAEFLTLARKPPARGDSANIPKEACRKPLEPTFKTPNLSARFSKASHKGKYIVPSLGTWF